MQLSISQVMSGKQLVIRVPPAPAGEGKSGEKDEKGREQLELPDTFCHDPGLFDKAIEQMRTGGAGRGGAEQLPSSVRSDLTADRSSPSPISASLRDVRRLARREGRYDADVARKIRLRRRSYSANRRLGKCDGR